MAELEGEYQKILVEFQRWNRNPWDGSIPNPKSCLCSVAQGIFLKSKIKVHLISGSICS